MPLKSFDPPPLPPFQDYQQDHDKLAIVSKRIEKKILKALKNHTKSLSSPVDTNPEKEKPITVIFPPSPDEVDETVFIPVTCAICGRDFHPDRINLHKRLCLKAAQGRTRQPFISSLGIKQVDGDDTVEDQLAAKIEYLLAASDSFTKQDDDASVVDLGTGENEEEEEKDEEEAEEEPEVINITDKQQDKPDDEPVKPVPRTLPGERWKQEHERFIERLYQTKDVISTLASGFIVGIPPPPGEHHLERDYEECPTCLRRYNGVRDINVAIEHFSLCRDKIHNRPKIERLRKVQKFLNGSWKDVSRNWDVCGKDRVVPALKDHCKCVPSPLSNEMKF